MLVLRLFAGKILHKISPLTLLALSSVLAIFGLYTLSISTGWFIFLAATLYGLGKTFFWPTTLGVVAEQTPKGGALTLNAISGIGMLTVGMLGAPIIGVFQSNSQINELQISTSLDLSDCEIGSSICCNGVCLTATEISYKDKHFIFKVSI